MFPAFRFQPIIGVGSRSVARPGRGSCRGSAHPVSGWSVSVMGLTVKKIARLKTKGRYRDGRNLFLQVSESGAMSWLLRYRLNHRDRWLGLGSHELFSIEEARDRAHAARRLIADRIDPLEQRRADRSA